MAKTLKGAVPEPRKKIFIVEAHPTFRQGLIEILKDESRFALCGTAGCVGQALRAIARSKPNLVLMDISLPGRGALELIRKIHKRDRTVKLLVISMHNEPIYAAQVLKAGANGYILKHEDPDELVQAVHDVIAGHIYVSEEVMENTGTGRRRRASEGKSLRLDPVSDIRSEMLELQSKSSPKAARELRPSETLDLGTRLRPGRKQRLRNDQAMFRFTACGFEAKRG